MQSDNVKPNCIGKAPFECCGEGIGRRTWLFRDVVRLLRRKCETNSLCAPMFVRRFVGIWEAFAGGNVGCLHQKCETKFLSHSGNLGGAGGSIGRKGCLSPMS